MGREGVAVEIGELRPEEQTAAVAVLARGMRDIPMHVAVYGDDPARRMRGLETLFRLMLPTMPCPPICARRNGTLVGIVAMSPPGKGVPPLGEQLRLIPPLLFAGPRSFFRLSGYLSAMARRIPRTPHWHVGPVAVDAPLQGQGIGSRMMEAYCARVDALGEISYLETDREKNVRFYGQFGFETVDEADILGVHNWFMRREPGFQGQGHNT